MVSRLSEKHKNALKDAAIFSKDIACLFSDLEITNKTSVQSAIFFQVISKLIAKSGRKSIDITMPDLMRTELPFMALNRVKRALYRLRELGVLRTKIIYDSQGPRDGVNHKTRIWINRQKILELAMEVKRIKEDAEAWERIKNEIPKNLHQKSQTSNSKSNLQSL